MRFGLFAIKFFVIFCATAGVGVVQAGCRFSWDHYGNSGVYERVSEKIGAAVPDEYCKYTNEYQIVLITASFSDSKMAQGFASVGLRKRGSNEIPLVRSDAVSWDLGNYTVAYAKDLAASAAIRAVTELMADIPEYLPKRK